MFQTPSPLNRIKPQGPHIQDSISCINNKRALSHGRLTCILLMHWGTAAVLNISVSLVFSLLPSSHGETFNLKYFQVSFISILATCFLFFLIVKVKERAIYLNEYKQYSYNQGCFWSTTFKQCSSSYKARFYTISRAPETRVSLT